VEKSLFESAASLANIAKKGLSIIQ
jgi:hypothetical protein